MLQKNQTNATIFASQNAPMYHLIFVLHFVSWSVSHENVFDKNCPEGSWKVDAVTSQPVSDRKWDKDWSLCLPTQFLTLFVLFELSCDHLIHLYFSHREIVCSEIYATFCLAIYFVSSQLQCCNIVRETLYKWQESVTRCWVTGRRSSWKISTYFKILFTFSINLFKHWW